MNYGQKPLNPGKQNLDAPMGPPSEEAPIQVDGFAQVLAMLKIADPEFRESILKRIAARDYELARSLRADLAKY